MANPEKQEVDLTAFFSPEKQTKEFNIFATAQEDKQTTEENMWNIEQDDREDPHITLGNEPQPRLLLAPGMESKNPLTQLQEIKEAQAVLSSSRSFMDHVLDATETALRHKLSHLCFFERNTSDKIPSKNILYQHKLFEPSEEWFSKQPARTWLSKVEDEARQLTDALVGWSPWQRGKKLDQWKIPCQIVHVDYATVTFIRMWTLFLLKVA